MLNHINTIINMLNNQLDKNAYRSIYADLEELLIAHFVRNEFYHNVNGKYVPKNVPCAQLTKLSTKSRKGIAEAQLAKCQENKSIGIESWVKESRMVMQRFLKTIHIGFLKEMYMEDSFFDVKIACNIHAPFMDEKESSKAQFKYQLQKLKEMGFVLRDHSYFNDSYCFPAVQQNYDTMTSVLRDRGAINITVECTDNLLDVVSFMVPASDIHKFDTIPQSFKYETSEQLNPDDVAEMKSTLSKLLKSFQYAEMIPKMNDTCCHLAELNFAASSKVVGYNGVVSKIVDSTYKQERTDNESIQNISLQISRNFDASVVPQIINSIKDNINTFAICEMGLTVHNLIIDTETYAQPSATLRFINRPNDYILIHGKRKRLGGDLTPAYQKIPGLYDVLGFADEYYLCNTVENHNRLMQILQSKQMQIVSMKSIVHNGQFVIKSINVAFQDISIFCERRLYESC